MKIEKYKRARYESAEVLITPEIAKEMLSTSIGNRAIKRSRIKKYSGELQRGAWRVTNSGIGFCWNGHLRDGHHRLTSIFETGIAALIPVTMGLDPSFNEVIDTGVGRTAGDILSTRKTVAECVKFAATMIYGNGHHSSSQLHPILDSIIGIESCALIERCNISAKIFSSVPMKFAAVITIIEHPEFRGYVHDQYSALCKFKSDDQSKCSRRFTEQVLRQTVRAKERDDLFARGLKVFDPRLSCLERIQVSSSEITECLQLARSVIRREILK